MRRCKGVDVNRPIGYLRALIYDLTSEDKCSLDHHGYCQAHGWMSASECPHRRAQALLAEKGASEEVSMTDLPNTPAPAASSLPPAERVAQLVRALDAVTDYLAINDPNAELREQLERATVEASAFRDALTLMSEQLEAASRRPLASLPRERGTPAPIDAVECAACEGLREQLEQARADLRQLSEIETEINRLSPPNFRGQGEVVPLVDKVRWLIARRDSAVVQRGQWQAEASALLARLKGAEAVCAAADTWERVGVHDDERVIDEAVAALEQAVRAWRAARGGEASKCTSQS